MFGLLLLLLKCPDFALGGPVVLHQRNARRADIGTGAAFDTVEQVVGLQLLVLLAQGKEMQLLRQQARRAGLGTFAAAYARQGRRRGRQFFASTGEQAVGGLDQWDVDRRQSEPHHRATHDQAIELALVEAGECQQLGYRRADQCFDVHRSGERFTREGGDPRDQRAAEQHRIVDGDAGTDVLAKHADVCR